MAQIDVGYVFIFSADADVNCVDVYAWANVASNGSKMVYTHIVRCTTTVRLVYMHLANISHRMPAAE